MTPTRIDSNMLSFLKNICRRAVLSAFGKGAVLLAGRFGRSLQERSVMTAAAAFVVAVAMMGVFPMAASMGELTGRSAVDGSCHLLAQEKGTAAHSDAHAVFAARGLADFHFRARKNAESAKFRSFRRGSIQAMN